MIQFDSVSKYVGIGKQRTLLFQDVDLKIERGRAVGVLGARGAGKSTLIGLVNANSEPDEGRITHGLRPSWPLASNMTLNKNLTVLTNLRFLAGMYGAHTPDVIEQTCQVAGLTRAGLAKTPAHLSREMSAHIAMGVCLALDFECYVADENLVSGSRGFRERIMRRLHEMKATHAFFIATRNLQIVREFCDEVHTLARRTLLHHANKGEAIREFKLQHAATPADEHESAAAP